MGHTVGINSRQVPYQVKECFPEPAWAKVERMESNLKWLLSQKQKEGYTVHRMPTQVDWRKYFAPFIDKTEPRFVKGGWAFVSRLRDDSLVIEHVDVETGIRAGVRIKGSKTKAEELEKFILDNIRKIVPEPICLREPYTLTKETPGFSRFSQVLGQEENRLGQQERNSRGFELQ